MTSSFPLARRDQMTVQDLNGELVVFDSVRSQANVLNQTAAIIWKLSDGKTPVAEIAKRASQQLNAPVNESLVWYTLDQLSKKHLLETRLTVPLNLQGMSRRDFLRAGAMGAAVLVPVIVTMTAPKAAQAASCLGDNQPCTSNGECCCNFCFAGFCVCG